MGRTLTVRAEGWPATPLRVVGIVRDVRPADADARVSPQIYVPWSWHPGRRMRFLIRTAVADPMPLVPAIRGRLAAVEPEPILRRVHDGPGALQRHRQRIRPLGTDDGDRAHRAGGCGSRRLRPGRARRDPAHARDWGAPRAGRATRRRGPHGGWRRGAAGNVRGPRRSGGRDRPRLCHRGGGRGQPARSGCLRHGRGDPVADGAGRHVLARAAGRHGSTRPWRFAPSKPR